MLDPKISGMARERIEVAIEERWSLLAKDTSDITGRMARRGVYRSSMTAHHILELYRNELDIQACIAWSHLRNVLMAVGVHVDENLMKDLKDFMREIVDTLARHLLEKLDSVFRPLKDLSRDSPRESLEKARLHGIRKISSEIELFEAALARELRPAQPGSGAQINISGGQIGILQTGASSSASMTVHLDSTSKQEIGRALDRLQDLLDQATHVPFDRTEITEMIRECKAEVEKPHPNSSRLKSLMTGIATTIQTVSSLRPAYETLKGALALVGVPLP